MKIVCIGFVDRQIVAEHMRVAAVCDGLISWLTARGFYVIRDNTRLGNGFHKMFRSIYSDSMHFK